ncbi:MAG: AsnC family transcriptional regulator [Thermoplasmata archaeon HGW-Thermoplasmata-2]|nr:MAG: AsnC family transcriptional regulator [Thermoplasmata archaeon HGW-Thermoplasmata-2]
MDDLDRNILNILNRDARTSFREIAKVIGVSVTTVASRISRMEKNGTINGYVPLLEPEALGYDLTALIGLKIKHGELMEVQKALAKDSRVFGIYDVTGEWDSIVVARFKGRKDLDRFIKNTLSAEGIERTYTQIVLNVIKDEKRVLA